jgi:hypothetical protein
VNRNETPPECAATQPRRNDLVRHRRPGCAPMASPVLAGGLNGRAPLGRAGAHLAPARASAHRALRDGQREEQTNSGTDFLLRAPRWPTVRNVAPHAPMEVIAERTLDFLDSSASQVRKTRVALGRPVRVVLGDSQQGKTPPQLSPGGLFHDEIGRWSGSLLCWFYLFHGLRGPFGRGIRGVCG